MKIVWSPEAIQDLISLRPISQKRARPALIFLAWLSLVIVAVLIGIFPNGNGVLRKFG
jgi:hypothetical protein